MSVSRRRLFQSLAVAGVAARAQETVTIEALRGTSQVHGTNLGEERLRVVRPVIEQRMARVKALRDFVLDDSVAPTQGILS